MVKNVVILLLFVASWSISGMDSSRVEEDNAKVRKEGYIEIVSAKKAPVRHIVPNSPVPELEESKLEYIELDCSIGTYKACKGRCYEKETRYNIISRHDQKLWAFYDPILGIADSPFRSPLIEEEYDALKIHTCLINVKRPGQYFKTSLTFFPRTLITKFEFNPQIKLLQRPLETFFKQLVLVTKESKIYAWVSNKRSSLLNLLTQYSFIISQEILYIPSTIEKAVFCRESGILQLEANTENIRCALS